jgi:hypothetical protein
MAFCCLVLPSPASADWFENFDSYANGSGLHGQGGWHGWDGNPAADAYVSNLYSYSAPHSASVAGASDIVQNFSGYTSGVWIFTAWQYIPSEFSGQSYVLLLNTYNDLGPYNWSSQVMFDGAAGMVISDPEGDTLPIIRGQWVELRVRIDLDANLQTFYYDNQELYQKSWTEGVSGGGALDIGALDLFANSATAIYYDDISLGADQPTAVKTTTWGWMKQSFR